MSVGARYIKAGESTHGYSLLRRSAEAGYTEAQIQLAIKLLKDDVNRTEGLRWLNQARAAGVGALSVDDVNEIELV